MYYEIATISDTHIPFLDEKSNSAVIKLLKHIKPKKIILLGDIIDFWEISHFDKSPNRGNEIEQDIKQTKDYLSTLRDNFPRSEIIYMFGNHEDRMRKYVWRIAKELEPLAILRLENMLELDKLRFKYHSIDNEYYQEGILLFTHGTVVRSESAMTAKCMLKKYGMSVIHGHTHRLGSHYRTDCSGTKGAWENGCLCKLDLAKEWRMGYPPDWQTGISIVNMRNDQQLFHIDQIYIHNGEFVWGANQYKGEV